MTNTRLDLKTQTLYKNLANIGLSKQETLVYATLLKKGPLTVKHLAAIIGIIPNSIYRIVHALTTKKLIAQNGTYPSTYKVISPSIAFDAYAKNKIIEISSVKEALIKSLAQPDQGDQSSVEIMQGQF